MVEEVRSGKGNIMLDEGFRFKLGKVRTSTFTCGILMQIVCYVAFAFRE